MSSLVFVAETRAIKDPFWDQDVDFLIHSSGAEEGALVQFSKVLKRRGHWEKMLPITLKSLQKKVERKVSSTEIARHREAIKAFFEKRSPNTAAGWVAYGKCFENALKPAFYIKLKKFWMTSSLGKEDQDLLFQAFREVLIPVSLQRISWLLWNNENELAIRLIEKLKLPSAHGLKMVVRLLAKKAYEEDFRVLQDMACLPKAHQNWALVQAARIRFFIRASQAEEALKVWNASSLRRLGQDLTANGPVRQAAQESVDKLEIALVRDLCQEANRLKAEGHLAQALGLYRKAFDLHKAYVPLTSWRDYVWMQGLVAFQGLQRPQEALPRFLFLAQFPSVGLETRTALPKSLLDKTKTLAFPSHLIHRYRSQGYFWAGLCYEQMGQVQKAKACYEKAASYGFFFYGQMAQFKLGRPLKMKFASADPDKGFQTAALKEFEDIARHWKKRREEDKRVWDEGKKFFEDRGRSYAFIQDLFAACQTPHDAKKFLGVVEAIDPLSKVFMAKRLSNNPRTTFAEAYPTCKLPVRPQDPALVYAIILTETCFNPYVISTAGARGLMQIMPHQAERFARKAGIPYMPSKLLDPQYSIRLGIAEIAEKLEKHRLYIFAIAAYNAGSKKATQWEIGMPGCMTPKAGWNWIENIPYTETRAYVARVLESRAVYRWLGGRPVQPSEIPSLFCCPAK